MLRTPILEPKRKGGRFVPLLEKTLVLPRREPHKLPIHTDTDLTCPVIHERMSPPKKVYTIGGVGSLALDDLLKVASGTLGVAVDNAAAERLAKVCPYDNWLGSKCGDLGGTGRVRKDPDVRCEGRSPSARPPPPPQVPSLLAHTQHL
jgi:hypothetical protein